MIGKQLSRWTMAWFGAAMLFLILSLTLGLTGVAGPGDWSRGAGLGAVHLFTIGWLCIAMLGALIQFVPVLTATPSIAGSLSLPALLAAIIGTLMLASGFLWLDGHDGARVLFLAAPFPLALCFALVGTMLVPPMLVRASRKRLEVRMVLLAMMALVALWGSGGSLVAALAGFDLLPRFMPDGISLHVLLGIGGWLSLAAFGVSYRLFAMFLLAPEQSDSTHQAVFLSAGVTLGLVMLVVLMLATAGTLPDLLLWALVAAMPLTSAIYLGDVWRMWNRRRRAEPEGNMRWSRLALAFLALASGLAGPGLLSGGIWAEAAIFVSLTGWLSLLTLAQMVKITSFLTWLQVFACRIGREPVPLVQNLTQERSTARWLTLWAGGVVGGTLALLLQRPIGFRIALAAMLLAAVGLAFELVSIRRLWHLAPPQRPPHLPPLILPLRHAEL